MKITNKITSIFLDIQMITILCMLLFVCKFAFALPQIDQIVNGDVQISNPDAFTLRIDASDKSIIDFSSFDINANESVFFYLPSSDSSVLNRVAGTDISQIFGDITCNGIFFLISPGGIHIGSEANINAASIVLSTRDIDNQNFLNGNYIFNKINEGEPDIGIINEGRVNVQTGGFGVFIAGAVKNDGLVVAHVGKVAFATGDAVRIDFAGNNLISVAVDESTAQTIYDHQGNPITAQIDNTGSIENNGGTVILNAKTLPGIFTYAINLDGVVNADKIDQSNGIVQLTSNADIRLAAEVKASRVSATATAANIYIDEGSIIAESTILTGEKVIVRDINPTRFYGDMTFHNFEATLPNKEFFFQAGKTYTFNGTFKISGAYGQHIKLLSSQNGLQWFINPSGTRDITYAWVEDSNNVHSDMIVMTESTSRNNNFNWDPDGYWVAVSAGNWSDPANWSGLGGATPGAGDNVFFTNAKNGNCLIDQDITITNFTISGYTGKIDNESQDHTITVSGDFTASSGKFDLGSGILNVYGSYLDNENVASNFDLRDGTLNMLGNGTVKVTNLNNRPKYLNVAYPGQTTTLGNSLSTNQISVNGGSLNFSGYTLSLYESLFKINAATTYAGTGKIQYKNYTAGAPFIAHFPAIGSIQGDVNMGNITFELWNSNGTDGSAIAYLTNNVTLKDLQATHTQGYQYTEINTAGFSVTLTGAFTGTGGNGNSYDYHRINFTDSDVTFQAGVNLASDARVYAGDSTINVTGGNWYVPSAAYYFGENSQTDFSGTSGITMSYSSYFNDLTFTNANITFNSNIKIRGDLLISGGSLNALSTTTYFSGADIQMLNAPGKSFYRINHDGSGTLQLLSDLDINNSLYNTDGIFDANNHNISLYSSLYNTAILSNVAALTLDGNGAQTITNNHATINNLTITNTSSNGITLNDDLTVQNQLTLNNNVVFNISGTNLTVGNTVWGNNVTLKLQGEETLSGLGQIPTATGTVEYNGSDTYNNLLLGYEYNNLTIAYGTYILDQTLTVHGALTIGNSTATLDIDGHDITMDPASTFRNYGTFKLHGDETLTNLPPDLFYGTVVYTGSGDYSGLLLGYIYNNLTFDGDGTWTLSDDLDIDYAFTITNGTLNANAQTMSIAGNFINNGTFIHGNNEIILDGDYYQTIKAGNSPLYDLTITYKWDDEEASLAGDITIEGTFTLPSDSSFNFNSYNFSAAHVNFGNNMVFRLTGGQTISGIDNINTPGWRVEYYGSGTYSGLSFGDEYYDLSFVSSGTYLLDHELTIAHNLMIGYGSRLSLNGHNLTLEPAATLNLSGVLGMIGHETLTNFTLPTNSGTIEYNGPGEYYGLSLGNSYYRLQFAGTGIHNIIAPLTISNQLSIADATTTLNFNGQTLTLGTGSSFSNYGTLRLTGSETFNNFSNDTNSGTIEYTTNLANIFPFTYYNLKINAPDEALNSLADLTINGTLQLIAGTINTNNYALNLGGYLQTGGTMNAGTSQITSTGDFSITGGVFNAGDWHLILNASNKNLAFSADSLHLYDVTLKNQTNWSDRTITLGSGDITIGHALNIITTWEGDVIIDASTNNPNVTLNGTISQSGSGKGVINAGSGFWQFNQSLDLNGITFNAGTSNVILNAFAGDHTLTSRGQNFYDLTFTGDANWTLVDGLTTLHALNINSGSVNTSGQTLSLYNFNLTGGNFIANDSEITVTGALNFISGNFVSGTSELVLDATDGDVVFNGGNYFYYDLTLKNLSDTHDRSILIGPGTFTILNDTKFITFNNSDITLNASANDPNVTLHGNLFFLRMNEMELVENGGFESGLFGWVDPSGNVLVSDADAYEGILSLDMIRTLNGNSAELRQDFDLTTANSFSFTVKGQVEGNEYDYFIIYVKDANGNYQLARALPNDWWNESYYAEDWTLIDVDISSFGAIQGIKFVAYNDVGDISTLLVDNVSVKTTALGVGDGMARIVAGDGTWDFKSSPNFIGIEFVAEQSTVKLSAADIDTDIPDIDYYNLTIDGINSTWTLQGALNISHDFVLTNGTIDTRATNNYAVNIGNDVVLNGGIWEARDSEISVGHNWTKATSGVIFNHGQSHVVFSGEATIKQGLDASDTNANAFYNLTIEQDSIANSDITADSLGLNATLSLGEFSLTLNSINNNGLLTTSGTGSNLHITSANLGNITFTNTASSLPAKIYETLTLLNGGSATGTLNISTLNTYQTLNLQNHDLTVSSLRNYGHIQLAGSQNIAFSSFVPKGIIEYTGNANYSGLAFGNNYETLLFSGTGKYTVDQTLTVSELFSLQSGTFIGDAAINLHDFEQTGGFFLAPALLSLNGDFSRTGGTFTHRYGKVVFTGIEQAVTGDTSFYDFTKAHSGKLIFNTGDTQTITGLLHLNGTAPDTLFLISSSTGAYWYLNMQGQYEINNLNVNDSHNTGAQIYSDSNPHIKLTHSIGWGSTQPSIMEDINRLSEGLSVEDGQKPRLLVTVAEQLRKERLLETVHSIDKDIHWEGDIINTSMIEQQIQRKAKQYLLSKTGQEDES